MHCSPLHGRPEQLLLTLGLCLQAADAAEGRGREGGSCAGAEAVGEDAPGPVLDAGSGFRLDQRSFWDSLQREADGGSIAGGMRLGCVWQELTGPSDPLALAGRYRGGSASGELVITLRAYNR